MRRLVRMLIQLGFGVVCFVGVTAGLIIFDGLNDVGESADVALVTGREGASSDAGNAPALSRAARLYKDGAFPLIIVASDSGGDTPNFSRVMGVEGAVNSLEKDGVPASAIIKDSGTRDTGEMAADVAAILHQRSLGTLMIITDYYSMSRIKLALLHAGVDSIAKSHVGHAGVGDAWPIACGVGALYGYIFHTFVMPTAEKVKQEASDAAGKARTQAEKAKDNVDHSLDTLPK